MTASTQLPKDPKLTAATETPAATPPKVAIDSAAEAMAATGTADLRTLAEAALIAAEAVWPHERATTLPEGEWLEIAFMGHIEYRGAYVREVIRNGQPAYRVELPDYVFGGDRSAVRHHAASAWFGDQPVTEAAVREAWEAERSRIEERLRQEATWAAFDRERALAAGDGPDIEGEDPF